jgi:hypothetical protein
LELNNFQDEDAATAIEIKESVKKMYNWFI